MVLSSATRPGTPLTRTHRMIDPLLSLNTDAVRLLRRHGLLTTLAARQVMEEAYDTISLDASQQQQLRQAICNRFRIQPSAPLEEELRSRGMDPEKVLDDATCSLKARLYALQHFGHQVERRFLERKADLDKVVYSLLRSSDAGLISELYLRIADGEADFSELAAKYSEGSEKDTRGLVGPVSTGKAHPVLREALRTSSPGELVGPLRIEKMFLIARLESLSPAVLDESTQGYLAKELFQEWTQGEALRRISQLEQSSSPNGGQV